MKTINLFFDFEFTSLSPDAQPISLGIVSEDVYDKTSIEMTTEAIENGYSMSDLVSKSFYAEFSDFDLNRCDDWVKENVVGKLMTNSVAEKLGMSFENAKDAAKTSTNWSREYSILKSTEREIVLVGNTWRIREELKKWLSQFSEYNIQFVCDCGTFDWYWLLRLLAKWDEKYVTTNYEYEMEETIYRKCKFGLPKLPSNISPVPQDLNDMIALKKGISAREAFNLDRDELFYSLCDDKRTLPLPHITKNIIASMVPDKHNSLSDAKVIKAIYEKLK